MIVTRVNEHRSASFVGHLSAIYQNLSASEKNRAKIVQRELGIRQASNSKTPKDHTENKWLVGVQYELPLHLAPVMSSRCFQPNHLDSFDDERLMSIPYQYDPYQYAYDDVTSKHRTAYLQQQRYLYLIYEVNNKTFTLL